MKQTKAKRINWAVFSMAMLGVAFLFVFAYLPMFGVTIAFKDLDYSINVMRGLMTKPWVGFANFEAFLGDRDFINIMTNTIGLNVLQLLITFPAPILLAILINEMLHSRLAKMVQTITYFPYFISWVVYGGIILSLLTVDGGIVNDFLLKTGIIKNAVPFASRPEYFWWIVIGSTLLKNTGWGAVIFIAAIAGIDQAQYEVAKIDGANRFQRAIYITLPGILGTIIVMLLLNISGLLNSNFDQIYVFQNGLNRTRSEVIDTYVYRVGISELRYSYTTAVGFFKSVIAMLLLIGGHLTSKKIAGRGLF